jgi:hypothetical protein
MSAAIVASTAAQTPDVRRFHGRPVALERIDTGARRLMTAAQVNGLRWRSSTTDRSCSRACGAGATSRRAVARSCTARPSPKFAFAYMVVQLVDEEKVDLDRSIANYRPKPLPEFPFY